MQFIHLEFYWILLKLDVSVACDVRPPAKSTFQARVNRFISVLASVRFDFDTVVLYCTNSDVWLSDLKNRIQLEMITDIDPSSTPEFVLLSDEWVSKLDQGLS